MMQITDLIPNRWRKPASNIKKLTGRLVVTYWDREHVYYLVSTAKGKQLAAQTFGAVRCDQKTPLAALADRLRESNLSVQNLAILLSRPELEQATLTLPPSTDEELPVVVIGSMEQQLGEAENPPAVDYLRLTPRASATISSIEVQAFALPQKMIDSQRLHAEQAGFRLVGIGSRQLAALSMMRRVPNVESSLNISIQVYPGEIELTLCEGIQPRILRSIRFNQEEPQEWTELISREVQRCVTLLPPEVEQLKSAWIIHGNCAEAKAIFDELSKVPNQNVICLEPLADWIVDQRLTIKESDSKESLQAAPGLATDVHPPQLPSGALVGASWELWNDCLTINLLAPKLAPKPPNPYIKPAVWSTAAALALATIGYALKTDVWSLEGDVQKLKADVQESTKLTAKMQEKSDQANLVDNWLTDQVDWLRVLGEISNRMPDGQDATVGRLTASTNGKQGMVDLSVQVADPEKISQLESKLRSVKYMVNSKRISQSPEASEYPWRFETRIQFEIEPKDWSLFAAPKTGDAPGKSQTSTEPSKSPKQKTSGGSAKPDGAPEAVGQTAEVKP